MSITISPEGNGRYTMRFQWPRTGFKGYSHTARNLVEVHNALDHHLTGGANSMDHANGAVEDCPLCRSQREKAAAEAKAANRLTFTKVRQAAETKGLIFDNRVEYEGGKISQRYSIIDNERGVETGVLTLAEAMAEIQG